MKKSCKAQSAMEFLMTYGWALLLVLVVIGSLAFFGVLDPDKFLPEKADLGTELTVLDSQVEENAVVLLIKNTAGKRLTNISVNVSECEDQQTTAIDLNPEETQRVVVHCSHSLVSGSTLKSDVSASYSTRVKTVTLDHTTSGRVVQTVQDGTEGTQLVLNLDLSSTEIGYSVVETNDGGFAVSGVVTPDYDILLTKFSSSGVEQWTKTLNVHSGGEYGYSVIESSDGGLIVAGYTLGTFFRSEIVLSKFSSSGVEQWTKTLDVASGAEAYSIIESSDGGFVVTGHIVSGGYDVLLAKFNSAGVEQWTRRLAIGSGSDQGYSVIESSDGGFVITGYSDDDLLLTKFSSSGVEQWTKTLDVADGDFGFSVIESSDGGFVITGRSDTGTYIDLLLSKFSSLGVEQWTTTLSFNQDVAGLSVIESSDGGFIVRGSTSSNDIILSKFDSTGNEQWTNNIDGNYGLIGYGSSLIKNSDDELVLTGYSTGDLLLIKTDPFGDIPGYSGVQDWTATSTETIRTVTESNEVVTESTHTVTEADESLTESDESPTVDLIYTTN